MATGWTEEEKRGSRKANGQHRRNRRQGRTGRREKKDGKLSSQNRVKADERKQSEGKARKRKHKGSTGVAAVGAKPGRMKGNLQKAEYEETEAKHGKPGGAEVEKQGSRKAERQHRRSHCETETGRKRKGRNRG